MSISDEQIAKLIEEYNGYVGKIVNRFYYFVSPSVKEELCHVGLIGLWKGILAYYRKETEEFDHKKFIATICTYIRYEMAALLQELKLIRISDKQWHNFVKATKLLSANPDISEGQIKSLMKEAGLRYDWYLKAKKIISPASLDMIAGEDTDSNMYALLVYNDNETDNFDNQSYIDYIIDSAMYGIKLDRDKKLIRTWLKSINSQNEPNLSELGRIYKLSSAMVSLIINRFIDICRFVRDCEYEFFKNPGGVVYLPEIPEKNRTYNGKKVPGVKWVMANRKWKVEITVGKSKSVYIGLFENYEDAVRARRDAEIKYRGFSNIDI